MDIKKDFGTVKTLGWGKPSYLHALEELSKEERPGFLRVQKIHQSKKFGTSVGDKIEAFFKKQEEKKETQKEKKVDYWESTIQRIQEVNQVIIEEETDYEIYYYEVKGNGDRKNFVNENEKKSSTRELKFAKSVGSDMKKFKWVVLDYYSWNEICSVYPWADSIIKQKSGIGIGLLIDPYEFETCIKKAIEFGLHLFWRNEIHEKDNLLVIRELTVAPKDGSR